MKFFLIFFIASCSANVNLKVSFYFRQTKFKKAKFFFCIQTGRKIANENQFPFMASVLDLSTRQIVSGAVIVNERFVLTSNDQFFGRNPDDFLVLYGSTEIINTKSMEIQSIITHPKFNQMICKDHQLVALLELRLPLKFDDKTNAIRLPLSTQNTDTTSATILAYTFNEVFKGHLEFSEKKIIDQRECWVNLTGNVPLPNFDDNNPRLCVSNELICKVCFF